MAQKWLVQILDDNLCRELWRKFRDVTEQSGRNRNHRADTRYL